MRQARAALSLRKDKYKVWPRATDVATNVEQNPAGDAVEISSRKN